MDNHATSTAGRPSAGYLTEPGTEATEGQVRAAVDRMATALLHQAEDAVASQQSMIAATMRDVARSLRSADASDQAPDTPTALGGGAAPILVEVLSDALETGASRIEAIDMNRVAHQLSRTMREQPIASAGLAALAGFALTRFARTTSR